MKVHDGFPVLQEGEVPNLRLLLWLFYINNPDVDGFNIVKDTSFY